MLENKIIKGYILLKSGLHIGGSEAGIHIGGIDNPVIKNPLTNMPYIPGSSIKGKMRFLLEHSEKLVKDDARGIVPIYFSGNKVAIIFGHLNHKDNLTYPTRVIFRDSQIIGAIKDFNEENITKEKIERSIDQIKIDMGSDFVEAKSECVINRLTGTAKDGGLRTIERISAGTVFDFEISLRAFKEGEMEENFNLIKKGLKLIENDALGGSGSRGSGKIKFFGLTENNKEFSLE